MQQPYLMHFSSRHRATKNLATSLAKTIALVCILLTGGGLFAQLDVCPDLPTGSFQVGDQVDIPIGVTNFTEVGALQLQFSFDANSLVFLSGSGELPNNMQFSQPTDNFIRAIYFDPQLVGSSFPDGTSFFVLSFQVIADVTDPQLLIDGSLGNFEHSASAVTGDAIPLSICGAIVDGSGSNGLPTATACIRVLNEPASVGSEVSFPVRLLPMGDITAFNFIVEYDEALYDYQSFTDEGQTAGLQVTTLGTNQLEISWSGPSTGIDQQDEIALLNFTALGNIDQPRVDVIDTPGSNSITFASGETTIIEACLNTAFDPNTPVDFCMVLPSQPVSTGESFTVPVFVSNFNGVGWFQLPLLYDPATIEIEGVDIQQSNPNIAFSWTTTLAGANITGIEWTGEGYSLPDGDVLLLLNFVALTDLNDLDISIDDESPAFNVANDFAQTIWGLVSNCDDAYLGNLPITLIAAIGMDDSNNCFYDENAPQLSSWSIEFTNLANGQTYGAFTGADGRAHQFLPPGTYAYTWSAPGSESNWNVCSMGIVPLDSNGQILYLNDVAMPVNSCPELTVKVSSTNLRPCFDNNRFLLQYANYGSAVAEDAYIDLIVDPAFQPNSSSLPYLDLGAGTYRFELGDLAINASGTISLTGTVDCNFPLGAAVCAEATIYPFRTECTPIDGNFLGGDVKVSSSCDGDSIRFLIENTGDGPTGPINFTVIEDVIIYMDQPGDLPAGASMLISVPATGGTYRLEAELPDFAPYVSQGLAIQEGCGSLPGGGISTGFVTGLPLLDGDLYFDRYCQETSAAYDPNDKQAIPAGVGAANFIEPNQRMDYKIRFQNTGNDTAFNVVIIDTIDTEVLDLTTFRPGIGSHDYHLQIEGNEVRFIFDDIQLVDSITNEPLSHGFVHFSIAQQPDLADGMVLNNRAGIYFDFNAPIITNYSSQTIGRNILVSKINSYSPEARSIIAFPSPTKGKLFFELSAFAEPVSVSVYDMFGREVVQDQLIGDRPGVELGHLPSGRYSYRLLLRGQLLQTGIVTKN